MTIPMLVLAGAGLAVAGCSSNKDNTTAGDTTATATATSQAIADSHTSQFLTDAIMTDNDEIKLGQLAADNGSAKGVRDFGTMLVTDHTAHKAQASQIATTMGVAIPDTTSPEADTEYAKLQPMKGSDFDKEFATAMAAGHQKALDEFQAESTSADPAQVTDMAKQTIPTLQKHLDAAKALQKG